MHRPPSSTPAFLIAIGVLTAFGPSVIADIDPRSGVDFVRVGAPGNAPWTGSAPFPYTNDTFGRGGVAYEYNIGRFEVTTAEWTRFFNAALDRAPGDAIPWVLAPNYWGATSTSPTTPGGRRWAVPAGNEMRPVGNISWYTAAVYCNWLHNNKSTDRSAFLSGAYDVSVFGGLDRFVPITHAANAAYWIPTWDEWLKAAHYDPNRNGPGQGGYWMYSNGTDSPVTAGPPGTGQANYGWRDGTNSQFLVSLGAYPQTLSPWGLLDAAGGTSEWTEGIIEGSQGLRYRVYEGSYRDSPPGGYINDAVFAAAGADIPSINFASQGFRIASAVPASPPACVLISLIVYSSRRAIPTSIIPQTFQCRTRERRAFDRSGLPDSRTSVALLRLQKTSVARPRVRAKKSWSRKHIACKPVAKPMRTAMSLREVICLPT